MGKYVSDEPVGNLFSERQFYIVLRNKANYYKKVLVPFVEYENNSEDTSDYKELNSELTELIYQNCFEGTGNKEKAFKTFWKNTSSIPRILPIIYFEKAPNNMLELKITEIAKAHYKSEISVHEFLLVWIMRFQSSEYSDNGILTVSDEKISSHIKNGRYKKLVNTRIVKPGVLGLEVLRKCKEKGIEQITDKQYRHARKLLNHDNKAAVNEIVDLVLSGESDDRSQENQIFKVYEFLGLCKITPHESNNSKYSITGLGIEITKRISKPFIYFHRASSTKDYIDYIGSVPRDDEREIIKFYNNNGGIKV